MAYILLKYLQYLKKLSSAGLAVTLAGTIAACANIQATPQPTTPSQPQKNLPLAGGQSNPLIWSDIIGKVSAPNGWQVKPCDRLPILSSLALLNLTWLILFLL